MEYSNGISSEDILNITCKELGFDGSNSFYDIKSMGTNISDIDRCQWLQFAKMIEAKKIFFIDNYPVILFFRTESNNEELIFNLQKKMWNMSRAPLFFVALPGEVRVYSAYDKPVKEYDDWIKKPRWLEKVIDVTKISDTLSKFTRSEVESERIFSKEDKKINKQNRADNWLLKNLKLLRRRLEESGLERGICHALIGRSIFIRYLEDRRVLVNDYFNNWECKNYFEILANKELTYSLFKKLRNDFNGDMFPISEYEEINVCESHLHILRDFLQGKTMDTQQELFFWAYQFDVIPIELISNIYEEFYHQQIDDKSGTHYTPSVLVEFVLSEALGADKLKNKKDFRILDPACGSGIFLVEAFRRVVRYQQITMRKSLSPTELSNILVNNIFGVDINADALSVAAFSLYLALLDFMEPADIRQHRLPKLIYRNSQPNKGGVNLYCENAFGLTSTEYNQLKKMMKKDDKKRVKMQESLMNMPKLPLDSHSFDLIIGNPPWGQAKAKNGFIANEWCNLFDYSVGDRELSQSFIWRASKLLKSGGEVGLIVSSGIFFKHHEKSKRFRQQWIRNSKIRAVFNFSHVRHVFFSGQSNEAISPFAVILYSNSQDSDPLQNKILYASAKRRPTAEKLQAVVIDKTDFKEIPQSQFLLEDFLWKTYLWGGLNDSSLISELMLNESLGDVCLKNSWSFGQGFTENGPGKLKAVPKLKAYPMLNNRAFERYRTVDLFPNKRTPTHVYRPSDISLFQNKRLLIKRGISQKNEEKGMIMARIEEKNLCFNTSINAIVLHNSNNYDPKIILGILWSSLARYFYFLTCSTWGFWHHEIHLEEILSLPIKFPSDIELQKKIIEVVDSLHGINEGVLLLYNDQKIFLEKELDNLVFDLYDLSEEQRDLVNDFCNLTLDFFYEGPKSNATSIPNNSFISEYVNSFKEIWDERLVTQEKKLTARVLTPNESLILISFELDDINSSKDELHFAKSDDHLYRQLLDVLPEKKSQSIYIDRVIKLIHESQIIVIKRSEKILWSKSQARQDASEFLAEVFKLERIRGR